MKINKERCIGCLACVCACPDGIEMKGGKAVIKNPQAQGINKAIDVCPAYAID